MRSVAEWSIKLGVGTRDGATAVTLFRELNNCLTAGTREPNDLVVSMLYGKLIADASYRRVMRICYVNWKRLQKEGPRRCSGSSTIVPPRTRHWKESPRTTVLEHVHDIGTSAHPCQVLANQSCESLRMKPAIRRLRFQARIPTVVHTPCILDFLNLKRGRDGID
jgi:hypothetical protein